MNNRSLSRGDAVAIGAAVLLFIASFLDVYKIEFTGFDGSSASEGANAWESDLFPVLPSVFLAGILGAGLIVGSRFVPQPDREFGGLKLSQWGVALAVTSAWAALWSLGGGYGADVGAGLIIGLLASLLLAGVAVATPLVPALKAPLTSGPSPTGPAAPFGAQPPGYGYPAAGGAANVQQSYQPTQAVPAAPSGTDPNFQPFWFAVPASRPLYGEDGSPTPVAELAPGTWYLAVEQRGQALVAQTQDGRRGVLQDTSGIQRG
ncbi:DUF5336 domain-containing protein [Streptomyces sp. NBC_01803]|uniref:DUF5336 domain-containing protein n=1 Tax=Streptomyces sp. NBC_01803 TaxID=2975946 RepID=UPI002DD90EDF|nr:DUF5336 domain-containing protein [Streptomyces sp. NBC_01803]WSA46435.1 DUF5336 domain-containing protein [Streptomyces sp. NBC_01803]